MGACAAAGGAGLGSVTGLGVAPGVVAGESAVPDHAAPAMPSAPDAAMLIRKLQSGARTGGAPGSCGAGGRVRCPTRVTKTAIVKL